MRIKNPKMASKLRGRPNNKKVGLPTGVVTIPPVSKDTTKKKKNKNSTKKTAKTSKTTNKKITKAVGRKKVTGKATKKKKPGPVKGSGPRLAPSVRRRLSQWEMEPEAEDNGDAYDGFYFLDTGFLPVQTGGDNEAVGNSDKEDGGLGETEEPRVTLRVAPRKRPGLMVASESIPKRKKTAPTVNTTPKEEEPNTVLAMASMPSSETGSQRVTRSGRVVKPSRKVTEAVD